MGPAGQEHPPHGLRLGRIKHAFNVSDELVAEHTYCDRGYRGHGCGGPVNVHIAGTSKRNKNRWELFRRRRRSAVEPVMGHLKSENRMGRNLLKGAAGECVNAVLIARDNNLRKLLGAHFSPLFQRLCSVLSRRLSHFEPLTSPNKQIAIVPAAA